MLGKQRNATKNINKLQHLKQTSQDDLEVDVLSSQLIHNLNGSRSANESLTRGLSYERNVS